MMLNIRVVPNAKQERLVRQADRLKVYLCAPAIDGRANDRLVAFLSETFHVKKRQVVIRHGLSSRDKLVEILES
jgi:hypothetical protein